MDHGFTNRDSIIKKGKMPMAPPSHVFANTELYSNFFNDDSTDSTLDETKGKNIISKCK